MTDYTSWYARSDILRRSVATFKVLYDTYSGMTFKVNPLDFDPKFRAVRVWKEIMETHHNYSTLDKIELTGNMTVIVDYVPYETSEGLFYEIQFGLRIGDADVGRITKVVVAADSYAIYIDSLVIAGSFQRESKKNRSVLSIEVLLAVRHYLYKCKIKENYVLAPPHYENGNAYVNPYRQNYAIGDTRKTLIEWARISGVSANFLKNLKDEDENKTMEDAVREVIYGAQSKIQREGLKDHPLYDLSKNKVRPYDRYRTYEYMGKMYTPAELRSMSPFHISSEVFYRRIHDLGWSVADTINTPTVNKYNWMGEWRSLEDLANEYGQDVKNVRKRLSKGWSLADAIQTPLFARRVVKDERGKK